jgi:osmoprotectant transport system substrate-binding protein
MTRQRKAVALLLAVGLLGAAACGGDDDDGGDEEGSDTTEAESGSDGPTILIGAQGFGESQILAEIYEQTLDDNGYEADVVEVEGNRELLFDTIDQGDVNMAIDYVASELEFLNDFAGEATNDLDETYALLEERLAEREMVAFEPAEAINVNAFTVTSDTAEELQLETLSDLAERGTDLTLGAPQDCAENAYCLPGLQEAYGLDLSANFTPLGESGLVAAALDEGEIDVGVLFSTDGYLAEGDYVVLEDDQEMLAADNIVPVATQEVADGHGQELTDLVNAVTAELTTEELVELNRLFDIENEDAEDIAEDWLSDREISAS